MIIPIAQRLDIYPEDGKHPYARTGDLSAYHLKKAGAQGVLLGHSEVGETPEEVNKKFHGALSAGLTHNILLLGEQWEDLGKPWEQLSQPERQRVIELVQQKFDIQTQGISSEAMQNTIISYEPAWGVKGSGKADTPPPQREQIEIMAETLRERIGERLGGERANNIRITYGGSMSPDRVREIMPLKDIDGFILGSAGITTQGVKEIIGAVLPYKKGRKHVLVVNWKAYELQESYETFIEVINPFSSDCDIYFAPPATDIARLAQLI